MILTGIHHNNGSEMAKKENRAEKREVGNAILKKEYVDCLELNKRFIKLNNQFSKSTASAYKKVGKWNLIEG